MKLITPIALLLSTLLVSACATTAPLQDLKQPTSKKSIYVKQFTYNGNNETDDIKLAMVGLVEGEYSLEYENESGYFFQCENICVKLPDFINYNRDKFPDHIFPGGVFIPRSSEDKNYRIYYYKLNFDSASGSSTFENQYIAKTGQGASFLDAGISAGLLRYFIESDRGQIIIWGDMDEYNVYDYVKKM